MFDFKSAIKEEKEGVTMYEDAAKEMYDKYPKKLYALQFKMLAKEEKRHHDILKKMLKEIENIEMEEE